VFNIPCLRHHPIKPITQSVPEAINGEFESIPSFLVGVALVVSTVTRVVSNHGPSSEGEGGQGENGNNVHTEAHGEHADKTTGVGPHDHLLEMTDIGRPLVPPKFFSKLLQSAVKASKSKVFSHSSDFASFGSDSFLVNT